MSLDTFERNLLTELRHHVAARTSVGAVTGSRPRRRWTVAIAGGGLASTAAAAVIVLGLGAASPDAAYAVQSRPDGAVVVTVFDLSDAAGLQGALAAKGVRAEVSYVPDFQQTGGQAPTAGSGAACAIALAKVDGGLRFTLTAAQIASGATLDIVTSGSSPTDVGSPVAVTWSGGPC